MAINGMHFFDYISTYFSDVRKNVIKPVFACFKDTRTCTLYIIPQTQYEVMIKILIRFFF